MKVIDLASHKELSHSSSSSQQEPPSYPPRNNWREYYLDLAELVSTRATCDRLHAGCVLVRDKRIIATGYNGSLPDQPHCDDVGHSMDNGHCIRTVHAEINAVLQCAKIGIPVEGATAYVSHTPCFNCQKLMKAAGIGDIHFRHEYKSNKESNASNKDELLGGV